jgi:hypothetical protein
MAQDPCTKARSIRNIRGTPKVSINLTKDWEAAFKAVIDDIPKVKKFEGKLGESAATLLKGIQSH